MPQHRYPLSEAAQAALVTKAVPTGHAFMRNTLVGTTCLRRHINPLSGTVPDVDGGAGDRVTMFPISVSQRVFDPSDKAGWHLHRIAIPGRATAVEIETDAALRTILAASRDKHGGDHMRIYLVGGQPIGVSFVASRHEKGAAAEAEADEGSGGGKIEVEVET